MQTSQLVRRNLGHYWRTNLAVVLGVATAVAVLAGALLVGDSVRASLRDLFLQRLGNTTQVITAPGFFREELAADIQNDGQFSKAGFAGACPLIAIEGNVSHEASGRRGSDIRVYGVDERFWKFHGIDVVTPGSREVLLSESLANELGARSSDSLLVRVEKLSEIPIESLHSRKEDLGSTLRLTVRQTLAPEALGDFSIQPQQTGVRAVFVNLEALQKAIAQEKRANLILLSENSGRTGGAEATTNAQLIDNILKARTTLDDFGIKVRIVGEPSSAPSAAVGGLQTSAALAPQSISLEHESRLIDQSLAKTATETANRLSFKSASVLSYLANSIGSGERSIPYSLVTALDQRSFDAIGPQGQEALGPVKSHAKTTERFASPSSGSLPPIVLNEWTARDLGVHTGDLVRLEYYVWHEGGRLETKTTEFQLVAVTPINGLAADRNLVPEYPGITGSEDLSDWDPPFPVDLKRVRKQDEDYWDRYGTTPKAFIPLETGQQLWQSRFGSLTSIRLVPAPGLAIETALSDYQQKLRAAVDPVTMGFSVIPVRAQGLEASRGATDFGEYFLYFSFFLVISALLLTALFFKLGVEQRVREIGVLYAMGFPASRVRRIFLGEGIILALVGSLLGIAGALVYGQMIMLGLRTWWVGAVGTSSLTLHVSPLTLLIGDVGGIVAALVCVIFTLRQLGKASTRSLLMGVVGDTGTRRRRDAEKQRRGDAGTGGRGDWATEGHRDSGTTSPPPISPSPRPPISPSTLLPLSPSPRPPISLSPRLLLAIVFSLVGVLLLGAAALRLLGQTPGFFGGGLLLLVAFLCFESVWLRREKTKAINGTGWWPLARLGFRNATSHPGRSVLCIALIASAAFIIVAVDAFRHREGTTTLDRKSGSGGFPLLAESLLPMVHDPNTQAGQEALNLANDTASPVAGVRFERFRVRPGDDASCLNLYQPRNPKIVAPRDDFLQSNRFDFASSIASTNEEKANPWLLLGRNFPDGAIPFIADANSATYVLHVKLGEDFVLPNGAPPTRLRLVATLANSVLQSELIISEPNFLRLFPEQEGYQLFLIDTPTPEQSAAIAATLEERLSDFGFDVVPTSERLANFHRVENTYLSTFQMLGGLGLVLGTLGMAAVLLRNVLERRRELALLRAVGYNSKHFALMVLAENTFLLVCGLIIGAVCALLAIAPVFVERGGRLPGISLGFLLLAVLISGLTASIVATWATLKSPLLPALRAE